MSTLARNVGKVYHLVLRGRVSDLAKNTMDMTKGTIWKQLLIFAVPLFFGNLFQQMYNTVDSLIVGNYVGSEALGAVTSVGSAINTFIGFFSGFATGAGVVVSHAFGAKDYEEVSDSVHTILLSTVIISAVLSVLGVSLSPQVIRFMNTPPEIAPMAIEYLRVYFMGILGLMLYNICSGILRAVGDSIKPLKILIFSSFLNIILDLIFVVKFNMGVRGVAVATIISQFTSDILLLAILYRSNECYQFRFGKLRNASLRILGKVMKIGFPAGLQMSIISLSNVFVISYINAFGALCTSGFGIYCRINGVLNLPFEVMSMAITTFTGQNAGAGKPERIKKAFRFAIFYVMVMSAIELSIIFLFGSNMARLFNQNPEVVRYADLFLKVIVLLHFICSINASMAGVMRGIGRAYIPMYMMLFCYVVMRQAYLFVMSRIWNTPVMVGFSFSFGWICCFVMMGLYFRHSHWEDEVRKNAIGKTEEREE